jgi:hypothetical protein
LPFSSTRQRIVGGADLDEVLAADQVRRQARARAVHVVDNDRLLYFRLDLREVGAAFQILQVNVPVGLDLDLGRARGRGAVHPGLDALRDVVERRAPVDLDLDAVVRRRVVARGHHDADAAELARQVADRGRRQALGHQGGVQMVGLEDLRDLARERVGLEALVVADDHRARERRFLAQVLGLVLLDVVGDGLGRAPHVLEGEVARDDAAPAVGAELDGFHHLSPVRP